MFAELRQAAFEWLCECDPARKTAGVSQLAEDWFAGKLPIDNARELTHIPGRPKKPELVSPRNLEHRSVHTFKGRATLIHALAHIEFNAINLALDAICRFPGMPQDYYVDWLQVAAEEALHFTLLATHLGSLGYAYGDFPAHNGLWEMAERTGDDLLARIALIPRTMEARGLDVTPGLRARLAQAGDIDAAAILDIILRDEIGHVQAGNRWYHWLCALRGLEPEATYSMLAELYRSPNMRGPFNLEARRAAGFSEAELAALGQKTYPQQESSGPLPG
jgi:uncharacterized ferritin-like protein (DUF455 family)